MKKGIDVKITTGSMGIPNLELSPFWSDKELWRKAADKANNDYWDMLRNINKPVTEDIDYIEVTEHLVDVTEVHGKWLPAGSKLNLSINPIGFPNEKED